MVSVLAEPPRWSGGRSMGVVEAIPAASLNIEELSSVLSYLGLTSHAYLADLEPGCLAVLVRLRRCKVK